MKVVKNPLRLMLPVSFLLLQLSAYSKTVPLDSKNIHVTGAAYIFRNPEKLSFQRFSDEVLKAPDDIRMFSVKTASSTSGIILQFKTKSLFVHLTFSPEPGLGEKGSFKILKDGAELKIVSFDAAAAKQDIQVNLDSLNTAKESVYEVILPSYTNVSLTHFEIDNSSDLASYQPAKRKVYIGIGDSITHGRGQDGASYLTYPFLVSEKLNMDFYNLAIGGAKVSIPVAEMTKDLPKADVITVLIGYNDLNAAGHSAGQFEKDYREYLSKIRKNQPKAKIFCITLLYTKRKENPKTHVTPDDFRGVIKKVVTEYQARDKKLYLIEGDKITSLANLQPGDKTDPVHLTVKGAALFADALYKEMAKDL
ncbi:SGNH/GDSL hydrolase family protein [Pedobacter sp. BS3]|uniref:SGNH/GDSL hydrolase family protein n=1 Tax=Pedobacter sp. BS3 TaxID=2567937 RepID=UPI0011ED2A96|nr:SGNH/GDSL hydrolase family protein [Pedobacter sp. BS3]TZF82526.1 SGNH/GDSL hydrolase family protein [Pedobacter sp. BS3]